MKDFSEYDNQLSGAVINAAMRVHSALGPGLLEKVYEECLCYLLVKDGIVFERQKAAPVKFEDVFLETGFRIDLLVRNQIIVELKAVEKLLPLHEAQLHTYLKLTGKPIGLLLNFNVTSLRNGIKRIVMTKSSA